jgi:CRISPR-associated protein Cmr4
MAVRLLFVHALTSIHPGTGQGVGTIDLPIARERATNLPIIPGSTLKGCLKAVFPEGARKAEAFGLEDKQGKLRFSDARLLLLPVRCAGSTFVWATCPYVLRRFQRDCALLAAAEAPQAPTDPGDGRVYMADKSAGIELEPGKPRLVLEDLDFEILEENAKGWADWIATRLFADDGWRKEFLKRFAILSDGNFDYLCEFATEVNAHIAVAKDSGTAEPKALWYEETLPAETVLVALLEEFGTVTASEVVPETKHIRLGGNETTGQGLARLELA